VHYVAATREILDQFLMREFAVCAGGGFHRHRGAQNVYSPRRKPRRIAWQAQHNKYGRESGDAPTVAP